MRPSPQEPTNGGNGALKWYQYIGVVTALVGSIITVGLVIGSRVDAATQLSCARDAALDARIARLETAMAESIEDRKSLNVRLEGIQTTLSFIGRQVGVPQATLDSIPRPPKPPSHD